MEMNEILLDVGLAQSNTSLG